MPPAVLTHVGIQAPSMSSGLPGAPAEAPGPAERQQQQQQQQQDAKSGRSVASKAVVERAVGKRADRRSLDYVIKTGLAGGLAGCAAKTFVGPLDRVKILFQAQSPQFAKYSGSWVGLATALREINRTEGVRGLFRGHSATLLRVAPYAAIKFMAYEQFQAVLIPSVQKETPLRRLFAGSLAGLTSVFFTYPLEMIRVRLAFETKKDSKSSLLRICRQIYNEHPRARGGGGPTSGGVSLPASSSSSLSSALSSSGGSGASSSSSAAHLTAATVKATSQAVDAVTPRWGMANFYRGFSPTLLGILPYAGVSFLTHDVAGDLLRHPSVAAYTTTAGKTDRNGRPRLTNVAELVSGALASLVGQTSAYPLEIIRRRMQVGGAIGDGHVLRIGETAAKIWMESGWRGFFVGLGIGYTKVVPMGAISFWTYEKSKQLLGV